MSVGQLRKEQTIIQSATGEKPVIKVEPPQQVYEEKKTILRSKQVVWYIWGVIEIILLFRFLLKLFGANFWSGFSILIDIISLPVTFLFYGLFPSGVSPSGKMIV